MFYVLRNFTDRMINCLKWPVGFALFFGIYPMLKASYFYYENVPHAWENLGRFAVGFLFVVVVWIFLVNRKDTIIGTMEHEFTHALFAMLTFHKVVDFRASLNGSGSMAFKGKGNWLITIAPYFFPTLAVVILGICMIASVLSGQEVSWLNLALGFAVGYHFLEVVFEIHRGQTDLQKVGFIFSFMFIPAANILSYMVILSFVDRGWTGLVYLMKVTAFMAYNEAVPFVNYVWNLI